MKNIQIFSNEAEEKQLLEKYIKEKAADGRTLEILEAGCGRYWPVKLEGINYKLTGLDLDKDAMELRRKIHNDLDEMIVGDLRTAELEENKYDVIFNSFVLEHIDNAQGAIDNLYKWLKPDGILIIRMPDRDSVYGFITRFTPHWFHIVFFKYIKRTRPNAGQPGYGPYPTFYDAIVSRTGMRDYCRQHQIEIKEEFGHDFYLRGRGWLPRLTKYVVRTVSFLSLGKLSWEYSNLTYILRKQN